MIKHIKLYHYPATRSARVKWMLHEAVGDDFEVERVSLYDGEQYNESYLQKNPNHSVPALEITLTNGEKICMLESAAMVSMLADAYPQKNLAPAAQKISKQRADYLQMLQFAATTMDMVLWQIRVHTHILSADDSDEKTIERYRNKFISEIEPQLKSRLEKTDYICGDDFTAADCLIAHNVMWARNYQLCNDRVFKQYLLKVGRRPAFAKVFSDVKEFTVELPNKSAIVKQFSG